MTTSLTGLDGSLLALLKQANVLLAMSKERLAQSRAWRCRLDRVWIAPRTTDQRALAGAN